MPLLDPRTLKVLLTVLVVAAVLAFAYAARDTLIEFLLAIFFAYLVDPLVGYVHRFVKGSRGRAIAVVYVAILLWLALAGFLMGARLAADARHLAQTLPSLFEKLSSGQIAFTIGSQRGWSYETQVKIQHYLLSHQGEFFEWGKRFLSRLATLGKHAWWLVAVPILGAFFLKDGARFAHAALDMLSRRRQREFLDAVMQDVQVMLAHFIRAQLILAILSTVAYTLGLILLRVPYPVILGTVGGTLEFIPMVGPFVAFLGIVFIALLTGYKHLWIVIAFLAVWRGVQDYVNSPRIMGRHVELPGLAVLFGVLAGGEVAGVIGVFLSVPIMATLRIVWRHWRAYMDHATANVIPAADVQEIPPENVP